MINGVKKAKGYSLIELMISMAALGVVSLGMYRVVGKLGSENVSIQKQAKSNIDIERLLDQMVEQIENTMPINDASAPLMVNASSLLCGSSATTNSIVAFPYIDLNGVESLIDRGSLEPSYDNVMGSISEYDAYRIVFFDNDSKTIPLYEVSTGLGDGKSLHPTNDFNRSIAVPQQFESVLSAGDFFVLSDVDGSRFGRLTHDQTEEHIEGAYLLRHADSSVWNSFFDNSRDYGVENSGGAIKSGGAWVQKAFVRTYAYDPNSKIVYVDDHVSDDGFDEITQTYSGGSKSGGLAHAWRPYLYEVDGFKVGYGTVDFSLSNNAMNTGRTPRVSADSASSGENCENDLGKGRLKFVQLYVKINGKEYIRNAMPKWKQGPHNNAVNAAELYGTNHENFCGGQITVNALGLTYACGVDLRVLVDGAPFGVLNDFASSYTTDPIACGKSYEVDYGHAGVCSLINGVGVVGDNDLVVTIDCRNTGVSCSWDDDDEGSDDGDGVATF